MYKTNKKHFDIFKKETLKWIEYFGLKDWEIRLEHATDEENMAYVLINSVNRFAMIGLSKTWSCKPSVKELKQSAFHEVLELLLEKIVFTASKGSLGDVEIQEAKHDVIRRLENTIFKDFKP